MALFHITTRSAWTAALAAGGYRSPTLDTEGFIHLSRDKQLLVTANRFFRGHAGLVVLVVREDRLRARLANESADGELFPHLYGELNLDAVTDVFELPLEADGTIGLPSVAEGTQLRAAFPTACPQAETNRHQSKLLAGKQK